MFCLKHPTWLYDVVIYFLLLLQTKQKLQMEIDCKATEIEQLQSKLNETASLSSADNDPEDNQVSNQISKTSFFFENIFLLIKQQPLSFALQQLILTLLYYSLFFFFYFYISLATLKLQSSSSLTLHLILINYLFPMHPFTSSNQTYSSCISSGRQTKFIFRFNKKPPQYKKQPNLLTLYLSVCVSECFRIHLCFHLHRIRCLRAG